MYGCQQSIFVIPDNVKDTNSKYRLCDGQMKYSTIVNTAAWFTNLEHDKRHQPLDLYKRYSNEEYPKYDNYDAIEVSKVANIPDGYNGVMGVPISFLGKYSPDQFEIVGATESEGTGFSNGLFYGGDTKQALVNGQRVYKRIFIRQIV